MVPQHPLSLQRSYQELTNQIAACCLLPGVPPDEVTLSAQIDIRCRGLETIGTLVFLVQFMTFWQNFREPRWCMASQRGRSGVLLPVESNQWRYKIDTCLFLAWLSALLGHGKGQLARCQDNVTEWDIRSWCRWCNFPMGQHYKTGF